MPTVIHKPSPFQRLMPLLKGFDGPLAFGVFILACGGMLTMYSSGFANGARFLDHGRNMLLALVGDDGEFRVRTAIPIALASSFMSDRPAYCPYRAGSWAKPERRAHRLDRMAI